MYHAKWKVSKYDDVDVDWLLFKGSIFKATTQHSNVSNSTH